MITEIIKKILSGYKISKDEALTLIEKYDSDTLAELANEIRKQFTGQQFDTCSITNAKSGNCSEDCKWCAQSAFHKANIEKYELIDIEHAVQQALHNERKGVNRYSLVTSGKRLNNINLDKLIVVYKEIAQRSKIHLCASMGLLSKEQLLKLKEAGIGHYHCNLETSRKYFPEVCTTHTYDEKVETIKHAQNIGLKVCSGGIMGLGESMEDRIDFAVELRELGIKSIPLNFLMPVEGTKLEKAEPLSDEEVIKTIAIFRIINPDAMIRFAGGRQKIKHLEKKALKAGINAALVGDLLTTVGSDIDSDMQTFEKEGFCCKIAEQEEAAAK